ncbi:unnamed protein product [Gongylonema pulchrum]|uniref:Secreted protein n=1 Tax=Gongylonema pulchrum TaxID=637853 RepID=A0A183DVV7_9BILA|nr:unnamed protein product [Gongylonema pulchrum]
MLVFGAIVQCILQYSLVSENWGRTVTTAVEIPVNWKHVENLLPHRVVPDVPHHTTYPTPSGWRPPNLRL